MYYGADRCFRNMGCYGARKAFFGLAYVIGAGVLSNCGADGSPFVARARQHLDDTGGSSGTTDTIGGTPSVLGGTATGGTGAIGSLPSTTGGVFDGSSVVLELSISKTARFSELKIDPPSTDGNNEYIEISGDPARSLKGYFIVVVEGDVESNLGQIDKVIDLSNCSGLPCKTGDNGLLLLIAAEGVVVPGESATSVAVAAGLVRGGLENGTGYVGLFSGSVAPAVGSDWDTNDDGVLELPGGVVQHDALTWTDGDLGDGLYAVAQVGPKPLANATWRCDSTQVSSAWRYGLLFGDATSLTPDLAHFVPANLPAAVLTPGATNSCTEPNASTTEPPGTITSTGGTSGVSSSRQSTGGSYSTGTNIVASTSSGGTANPNSVTTVVVEGQEPTDGGESGWWSPPPFDGTAGATTAADVTGAAGASESRSNSVGGADDDSSDQPNVPTGCTVVSVVAPGFFLRNYCILGVFALLRRRRRALDLRKRQAKKYGGRF